MGCGGAGVRGCGGAGVRGCGGVESPPWNRSQNGKPMLVSPEIRVPQRGDTRPEEVRIFISSDHDLTWSWSTANAK